ncbi:MAG: HD domain-containing protein [Pseudomonadota bacterium]
MATLERAIEIAVDAHRNQVDKAGFPYILHPLRVMLAVSGSEEQMAALLHDVVEDSAWTLEQLAAEGFAEAVVTAVDALTKRRGESRIDAAHRAAAHPIARVVKLADNADNMDWQRLPSITPNDVDRMKQYVDVRAILLAAAS